MKFGVCIPSHRDIMPVEAVMEVPRRVEELGYDSVWVNDHVVVSTESLGLGFTRTYYDAYIVLAHAAARTSRVKLGSSIMVVPLRHPIVQAKMLSTLDAFSGGRVILGVGAGWQEAEFVALGVPFKERGAILDEALHVMNELWTADQPSFQGRYFSFSGVEFGPAPIQRPRIPIWVGGSSRAGIRRAARLGDAWHPDFANLADVGESMAMLREEWRTAGRQGEPVVTQRLQVRLFPEAREGRRRLGQGTAAQVSEDIEQSRALGVDYVVVDFVRTGSTTEEQWNYCLETFAREVMPKFS